MRFAPLLCLLVALLVPDALGGIPVRVTVTGEVEFNQINSGPLSQPTAGQTATMTFLLDTDAFFDSPNFPTRGYVIDIPSFELVFPTLTVPLQSPFPPGAPPFFVIRNDDPAVDGFFVARSTDFPIGVPLGVPGIFGPFVDNFSVTYDGATLSSLDLLDALGTYDFTGLTVFNWTLEDGGFIAMGLVFDSITIEPDTGPWVDLGCALAGVAGDPLLLGVGPLTSGSLNSLELRSAAPSATTGLLVSTSSASLPFKGGTLKPFPFLLDPVMIPTDPLGEISLPFVMPAGVPSGTELFLQSVIVDPIAPAGFAISNAVRGDVP